MTEKMFMIYNLLEQLTVITNPMDLMEFGSLMCMLSEEWAKAHNESILDFIDTIRDMMRQVHDQCGDY